jgi:hypothetical protein
MNHFPATPGSAMMVYADGALDKIIPILGWVYVTGQRADPIFPIAAGVSPVCGFCISINDEHDSYLHPHTGLCFESGREFGDHMAAFSEAWKHAGEDAPREEPADETGVITKWLKDEELPIPPQADTRPIHFGAKTFKQQSFWHWPDANCVFAIPGEQALPSDPRVLKVTGEEFKTMKREGADEIDPHNGEVIVKAPEDETPPARPRRDVSDAI